MTAKAISRPSPNFDARPPETPVDMLVLHYTGMETAAAALARMCDPEAKVSAHYVIDEDGAVISLVPEESRAWHAGESFWRGETDVNGRSVGIELVNPGHEFGYRDFPGAQMAALESLTKEILARHPIEARNVVGHSDISPKRKKDPGELFDWGWLAGMGVGLWPDVPGTFEKNGLIVEAMLAEYGYDTTHEAEAIAAFQRHFRPETIDGSADPETLVRLKRLLELCNT